MGQECWRCISCVDVLILLASALASFLNLIFESINHSSNESFIWATTTQWHIFGRHFCTNIVTQTRVMLLLKQDILITLISTLLY